MSCNSVTAGLPSSRSVSELRGVLFGCRNGRDPVTWRRGRDGMSHWVSQRSGHSRGGGAGYDSLILGFAPFLV